MSLNTQISMVISNNENMANTIYLNEEEIIVKQEKINDVPENERIKLDNDTIYRFSCSLNDDSIRLTLCEIGAFAPYLYRAILTLDGIKEKYKMFKSCDTLEQVQEHINRLFNDKKIKLTKENDDTILFNLRVFDISYEKVIQIEAKRIMTTKKNDALINLYKIQKDQNKILKEIENYIQNTGSNGNNIIAKINEIKKKFK